MSKKDISGDTFCHSAPPKGWDVDATMVVPWEPLVKNSEKEKKFLTCKESE